MADTKISALPVGAAIAGTELLVAVQTGANVQTTPAALLTYINANASLAAARITSGTLAVARGGTNIGSYTIGDMLYASAAGVLSALAGVATGNALISGGVGAVPAWGKVGLTSHISGILALGNGGSGADLSATGGANQVVRQNSVGGVLTVSALAAADIPNIDAAKITTGILVPSRGGTGVSNTDANTLTIGGVTSITGGGTLALGGFTGTLPATGTLSLLGTAQTITAIKTQTITDAATVTTTIPVILGHNSSGTPAASFGVGIKLTLASNTTADQDAAQIEARWTTATHATRTSKLDFSVVQAAGALTSRMTINDGAQASGVFVPWITGDSLPSLLVGATTAGMNQMAVQGRSNSNNGVYGVSVSGNGVNGVSTSGPGVAATSSSGSGIEAYAANTGQSPYYGRNSTNATNATALVLNLDHLSSGTPAAGFGSVAQFTLKSSTTGSQNVFSITNTWVVATHASRTARTIFSIYDTAAREALRLEASGTAPMIGFLGAAAVVQQASAANLTNNVTSGGTDDTIANFTDLTIYANDSAAIRNDIYQLARKVKQVNDALRLYGLLT